MKFFDIIGTELNENEEVVLPLGGQLTTGRIVKLLSGLGLDGAQSQPMAVIAAHTTQPVTQQGQVLNVISVKSIQKGTTTSALTP